MQCWPKNLGGIQTFGGIPPPKKNPALIHPWFLFNFLYFPAFIFYPSFLVPPVIQLRVAVIESTIGAFTHIFQVFLLR